MRQGPNGRRPRGRHHGGGHDRGHERNGNGGGNMGRVDNRPRSAASLRHQTFDSNCIDLRVRGNAWQVHEKYQALARDAQSSGDRVAAENYLQHAEHYFRIIEAINEATAAEQRQRPPGSPPVAAGPPGAPPPLPFAQQPETPANYYGTGAVDNRAGAQSSGPREVTAANAAPLAAQEAEVQTRNPPPARDPFAAAGEAEEPEGPQAFVARR